MESGKEHVWTSTANAISVGYIDAGDSSKSVTRQITGVAAGSADTDAVNVAQIKVLATKTELSAVKSQLEGRVKVTEDLLAGDWGGKTVKELIDSKVDKADVQGLAQAAVNVVGDGSVSVAKSDVSGVDTYTVSVATDGKVEKDDTGIVTGGTVYTETRVTADGNYIKAGNSAKENLEALDGAIGTTADGTYVKASNSVGENLGALDAEIAALAGGTSTDVAALNNRIGNVDNKINKVGAGAAALAALHPIDTDDKFTMGMGYGNYRDAHSAAIGMFYRPTGKIMLSVGGAFGNGENMVNAGVSFALDKGKGFGASKAAMARKIAAQDEKIAAQDAEIAALKEALARLESRIGK